MKSKVAGTAAVLVVASVACLGIASCAPRPPAEPVDAESATEPDGVAGTAGEDDYRIEIAAIAAELGATVQDLDGPLSNPNMEDDDWNASVSLALSDIITLCDEASQIVPPDSMANTHLTNLETIERLNNAVGLLTGAIDEADTGTMDQAFTEMWLAAETLAEITDSSE